MLHLLKLQELAKSKRIEVFLDILYVVAYPGEPRLLRGSQGRGSHGYGINFRPLISHREQSRHLEKSQRCEFLLKLSNFPLLFLNSLSEFPYELILPLDLGVFLLHLRVQFLKLLPLALLLESQLFNHLLQIVYTLLLLLVSDRVLIQEAFCFHFFQLLWVHLPFLADLLLWTLFCPLSSRHGRLWLLWPFFFRLKVPELLKWVFEWPRVLCFCPCWTLESLLPQNLVGALLTRARMLIFFKITFTLDNGAEVDVEASRLRRRRRAFVGHIGQIGVFS